MVDFINKCDFGAYLKGIFYLICNCMYQGNGCKWVLDSEIYSAIVCCQSTWYLYLYLIEKVLDVLDAIQVLWVLVLVLELANFKSTCTWLKYFRKYLAPTLIYIRFTQFPLSSFRVIRWCQALSNSCQLPRSGNRIRFSFPRLANRFKDFQTVETLIISIILNLFLKTLHVLQKRHQSW